MLASSTAEARIVSMFCLVCFCGPVRILTLSPWALLINTGKLRSIQGHARLGTLRMHPAAPSDLACLGGRQ
jgi:hypothetical protein